MLTRSEDGERAICARDGWAAATWVPLGAPHRRGAGVDTPRPPHQGSARRRRGRICWTNERESMHRETPALSALANLLDRRNDIGIGAAAADVAAHQLLDRSVLGTTWFLQQRDRGHDLTRSAIAALISVMGEKRLLHGMHCLRRT